MQKYLVPIRDRKRVETPFVSYFEYSETFRKNLHLQIPPNLGNK